MEGGRVRDLDTGDRLVGVWTSDTRHNLVIACERVCEYFNINPKLGLTGAPLRQFLEAVHPDDRQGVTRSIAAAMATGDAFTADYRVMSTLHGTRWVHASGQCFFRNGEPTHLSGYLVDADPPIEHIVRHEALYGELVELLAQAKGVADHLGEALLQRLIDAVMLEAGFRLAERMKAQGIDDNNEDGDGNDEA